MKMQIYECNGGEMLFCSNGKLYHRSFSPQPGRLLADLVSEVSWLGNLEIIKADDEQQQGKLIAEFDGTKAIICIDAMGNSGKQYAGIED